MSGQCVSYTLKAKHWGSFDHVTVQFPDCNCDDMGDTYLGVMSDW